MGFEVELLGLYAIVLHRSELRAQLPQPRLASGDADGDRASRSQHAVEDMDGDVHLEGLALVRARAHPPPVFHVLRTRNLTGSAVADPCLNLRWPVRAPRLGSVQQGHGGRSGQQDGPHPVGHDGERLG